MTGRLQLWSLVGLVEEFHFAKLPFLWRLISPSVLTLVAGRRPQFCQTCRWQTQCSWSGMTMLSMQCGKPSGKWAHTVRQGMQIILNRLRFLSKQLCDTQSLIHSFALKIQVTCHYLVFYTSYWDLWILGDLCEGVLFSDALWWDLTWTDTGKNPPPGHTPLSTPPKTCWWNLIAVG